MNKQKVNKFKKQIVDREKNFQCMYPTKPQYPELIKNAYQLVEDKQQNRKAGKTSMKRKSILPISS